MNISPRRRRFITYFHDQLGGDRARLTRESGFTQGRISQLFDPRQPFGEGAARNLAERLGLPPDYFERDPPGIEPGAEAPGEAPTWMLDERERDVLRALRALSPERRLEVAAYVIGQAETQRYMQKHAEPARPTEAERALDEHQSRLDRIREQRLAREAATAPTPSPAQPTPAGHSKRPHAAPSQGRHRAKLR